MGSIIQAEEGCGAWSSGSDAPARRARYLYASWRCIGATLRKAYRQIQMWRRWRRLTPKKPLRYRVATWRKMRRQMRPVGILRLLPKRRVQQQRWIRQAQRQQNRRA